MGGMTEPFKLIPDQGNRDIFVFGDHASNYIPPELENLGLRDADMIRHIALDIGTATVIRSLCAHFKCPGQLAGFSRLLIDPNRDTSASDLIPESSDGTSIPGNQALEPTDKQHRIDRFYQPYHDQIGQTLDRLASPFVIYIHSFTPKPKTGQARRMDFGLLMKHDPESAVRLRKAFKRANPEFKIEVNQPYSAEQYNHTMDTHVAPRILRHLAIEIRQDHIDSEEKALKIAAILAERIGPIIENAVSPNSN